MRRRKCSEWNRRCWFRLLFISDEAICPLIMFLTADEINVWWSTNLLHPSWVCAWIVVHTWHGVVGLRLDPLTAVSKAGKNPKWVGVWVGQMRNVARKITTETLANKWRQAETRSRLLCWTLSYRNNFCDLKQLLRSQFQFCSFVQVCHH